MYWRTYFLLIQHNQEKRAMSPDPFPFCGWGLPLVGGAAGHETNYVSDQLEAEEVGSDHVNSA